MNIHKVSGRALAAVLSIEEKTECIIFVSNIARAYKFFISNDIEIIKYFPFLKAVAVKVDRKKLWLLLGSEYVNYITPTVMAAVQNETFFLDINLYSKLESLFDGEGVTVAVIDTGIYPHLDFCIPKYRIKAFVDFVGEKDSPYDDNGHGTLVASAVCGNGLVSNYQHRGVAPKAELAVIKCMNADGVGGTISILEGMQWIIDNYKKYNISVVCMAFGASDLGANDPFKKGVKALTDLGIAVVCAAGNSGPEKGSIKSPASSPYIITVGGVEKDEKHNRYKVPTFSSRGPVGRISKPDIAAPAVKIMGCSHDINKGFYDRMTGTSIATGIVSGCVCLIKQKYNDITPSQIKALIKNNAIDLGVDRNSQGAGLINMDRILI